MFSSTCPKLHVSLSTQQHDQIAELSLPKALSHCEWLSPVTATHAFCITLMMFRFHLCSGLNLALSLGTFWPTRLHMNLEVVIICGGFYTLPLPILLHIYQENGTVIRKEGKRIYLSSLQTVENIHMITPSPVTAALIFHEKYEKMLIVTKLDRDLNKNPDTLHRYSPTFNSML